MPTEPPHFPPPPPRHVYREPAQVVSDPVKRVVVRRAEHGDAEHDERQRPSPAAKPGERPPSFVRSEPRAAGVLLSALGSGLAWPLFVGTPHVSKIAVVAMMGMALVGIGVWLVMTGYAVGQDGSGRPWWRVGALASVIASVGIGLSRF